LRHILDKKKAEGGVFSLPFLCLPGLHNREGLAKRQGVIVDVHVA
jgi:hypothetical protein